MAFSDSTYGPAGTGSMSGDGNPKTIRCDNGREFVAATLISWLTGLGVELAFIADFARVHEAVQLSASSLPARSSSTCAPASQNLVIPVRRAR